MARWPPLKVLASTLTVDKNPIQAIPQPRDRPQTEFTPAKETATPHSQKRLRKNQRFIGTDAEFATFDRHSERGGYLPPASVRISFSESTEAGDEH